MTIPTHRKPVQGSNFLNFEISGNLILHELEALDKKWKGVSMKSLESVIGYTTMFAAARDGDFFLRGGAVYNPDTKNVSLLLGGRLSGKSLTLLSLVSQGYTPLANSHVRIRIPKEGNKVEIYPQLYPNNDLYVRVNSSVHSQVLKKANNPKLISDTIQFLPVSNKDKF